jgi:uncharacterized protein (TIGR04255 family)
MDEPTATAGSSDRSPSYGKAPLDEVVCGVRFQTPDRLRLPHTGLLWEKFRSSYPKIEHAPPIAAAKGEISTDGATGLPLPRVWFINESEDQLVQFQFDRFYFNWRRRQAEYPRYSHVIRNFESVYDAVVALFHESQLGELKPLDCELSYINHVVQGRDWNTIDDLEGIFSDLVWHKRTRFLPTPDNLSWLAEFPLEEMGTVRISLKHATRIPENVRLFVLELTARGIGPSTSKADIRKWFDVAHQWLLKGFTDLITPEIQRQWERRDRG